MAKKLKKDLIEEVSKLNSDIMELVNNPTSIRSIELKVIYKTLYDIEKQVFSGSATKSTEYDGLLSKLQGGVKQVYYADKSDITPIEQKGFEVTIDLSKGGGYRKQFDKMFESGEPVLIALFEDGYKKYENGEWVKI